MTLSNSTKATRIHMFVEAKNACAVGVLFLYHSVIRENPFIFSLIIFFLDHLIITMETTVFPLFLLSRILKYDFFLI